MMYPTNQMCRKLHKKKQPKVITVFKKEWGGVQSGMIMITDSMWLYYGIHYEYGILNSLKTTLLFETATMKNYWGWKPSALSLTLSTVEGGAI